MEKDKDIDEVEVVEECPRKPTSSEDRSAIYMLISYSLFVYEVSEEVRSRVQLQQIEALAERIFRGSLYDSRRFI